MKKNKKIVIERKSIAKQTEDYINNYPDIKKCLEKGLINYSALSRKICKDLKLNKFEAVLISIQRLYIRYSKNILLENEIIDLLKNSKLIVRTNILIAIIEKPKDFEIINFIQRYIKKEKEDFNLIEGEETYTIITSMKFLNFLKEKLRYWLLKINQNLIKISIVFDEKIETTPGVVAYVYSLFSEKGINIVEEMSCWRDLFIVIENKDLSTALSVLKFN
ncbi:MAG: ACT domain-containing protein [Candidatus Woesearchaeota archaeon]